MNNLKLILIGLCLFGLVVLFSGCSSMPVCTSVVKFEVCPTK